MYAFVSVPTRQENSISLVKAYWNELFTLGLAQCWQVMNVATILATFVNCLHSSLQQGKKQLIDYVLNVSRGGGDHLLCKKLGPK